MAGHVGNGVSTPYSSAPPAALPVEGFPVLAIDDRVENLVALEAVLEPLGLDLTTATSGEEGLRRLLEREFSLILLDVRMPGMDGLETAELIKSREHTQAIPIVFMTAAREEVGELVRGYGIGAVDYVLKPLDPDLLRSKVAVFAQLGQSRRLLNRSEALLRGAFDAAPVAKTILDSEHRLVRANPAFERIVGSVGGGLVGRDILDFCDPKDHQALTKLLEEPLDTPEGSSAGDDRHGSDLRLLTSDGRTIWVAPAASAIDATGLLNHLLLVQWVDVTARRRAEQARAELLIEQAARGQAEALAKRLEKLGQLMEPATTVSFADLLTELATRLASVLDARAAQVEVFGDAANSTAAHVGQAAAIEPASNSDWEEMPLVIEQETIGQLRLVPSTPVTAAERDLLRDAADRISVMVRRAQLHERERQIALELQRGLRPVRPPDLPGVRIAAQFDAAGLGAEVGGDWYDSFVLPDRRLGVVIGDVTGSGIRAASLMGQLRSVTRAFAVGDANPPQPASVLTRLHRYHETIGFQEPFSVLYLIVDPERKQLVWANAGHPPPLLRSADGAVRVLEGADSLMCHFAGAYENRETTVAEGDTVVLYTDGLIERRGETIDDGIERLAGSLQDAPTDPAHLCGHLMTAAQTDQARPHDDLTTLVLRLTGVDAPVGLRRTPAPARRVQLKLAPEPGVPGAARRLLERSFGDSLDSVELERAKLAISELTTNAVCHGQGDILLRAELDTDRLLVEIIDEGSGFEHEIQERDFQTVGGWGLSVVDAETSRWGVHEGTTHVWFEIERSGPRVGEDAKPAEVSG